MYNYAPALEEDVRLFEQPVPGGLWEELRVEGLLPPEAPVPPG
jgi:hypothetical protein